jgi:hypothetical protein
MTALGDHDYGSYSEKDQCRRLLSGRAEQAVWIL